MSVEKFKLPLPFKPDLPVVLFQGRHGKYSHQNWGKGHVDMTNAIDFALPKGTPVVAVADGIVSAFYDESNEYYSGINLSTGLAYGVYTNFILLSHENGKKTLYAHLMKGSVRQQSLDVDQFVLKGQVIGITGCSGWIGPQLHLHFQCIKSESSFQTLSEAVEFEGYNGPLEDSEL